MSGSTSRDRLLRLYRPGKLEALAWTLGILLIATYAGARFWSAAEREVALARFEQQRETPMPPAVAATMHAPALPSLEAAPKVTTLVASAPDTSRWSAARIASFFKAAPQPVVPEAVLSIAALGMQVPVYPGTSEWNLNRGAGRIEGTAEPDAIGNVGIAAHRDGYFRGLADIQLGERITLSTLEGAREYRVTSIRVVAPDAIDVLAPTDAPVLTLVTCYPFYHVGPAPERFIVRAEQVPSASTKLSAQRRERSNTDQQQAAYTD